jgi:fructose-specific phosphotransferase system IIC component
MRRQIISCFFIGLLVCPALAMAGCSQAPSYDIAGSIFPAWLVCIFVGALSAVLTRWLLLRARIRVILPVLVYPSLAAAFTFAIWLTIFQ